MSRALQAPALIGHRRPLVSPSGPSAPLRLCVKNWRVKCAVGTGEIEGEGGKGEKRLFGGKWVNPQIALLKYVYSSVIIKSYATVPDT